MNSKSGMHGLTIAAVILFLCQATLISVAIGTRRGFPFKLPAICLVMGGSLAFCLFHLHDVPLLSSGLPHALVYSGLLAAFGLSLVGGREPVVTYFAKAIHGDISREVEAYTRRVTWAWCCFFGLQLAVSAILATFAPIEWWSVFVNILNAPLIVAMMLGERLTRPFWVANPPSEYLSDVLRMPALLRQRLEKRRAGAL